MQTRLAAISLQLRACGLERALRFRTKGAETAAAGLQRQSLVKPVESEVQFIRRDGQRWRQCRDVPERHIEAESPFESALKHRFGLITRRFLAVPVRHQLQSMQESARATSASCSIPSSVTSPARRERQLIHLGADRCRHHRMGVTQAMDAVAV